MMNRTQTCPTCESTAPHLHPAMQHGGEVQPCPDAWHTAPHHPAGRAASIKKKAEANDWVCFQQLGSPTYGLVLYRLRDDSTLGDLIVTTNGETRDSQILEIRSPQ